MQSKYPKYRAFQIHSSAFSLSSESLNSTSPRETSVARPNLKTLDETLPAALEASKTQFLFARFEYNGKQARWFSKGNIWREWEGTERGHPLAVKNGEFANETSVLRRCTGSFEEQYSAAGGIQRNFRTNAPLYGVLNAAGSPLERPTLLLIRQLPFFLPFLPPLSFPFFSFLPLSFFIFFLFRVCRR